MAEQPKITLAKASRDLWEELRSFPAFITVGMAHRGNLHQEHLVVYYAPPAYLMTNRINELWREGYQGYPVKIVETSRPIAA